MSLKGRAGLAQRLHCVVHLRRELCHFRQQRFNFIEVGSFLACRFCCFGIGFAATRSG
jgi:hypothetical protein